MKPFLLVLMSLLSTTVLAGDVANALKDVKLVTPYIWEILVVVALLVSMTLTNKIKKWRWLPRFLCRMKLSKKIKGKRQFEYKQLKSIYLDGICYIMSYAGVSWTLLQRYDNHQQVFIISGFIIVMQFAIIRGLFAQAKSTKFAAAALALKGNLYVSKDATMIAKVGAYATGGGVEKK